MNESKGANKIVAEWIAKAEIDLKGALCAAETKDRSLSDIVCFHAQQCAEKYLKALLVWKNIDFPRTHDIETLLFLLPEEVRPNVLDSDQVRMTEYATVIRYPGDYEPIPPEEAQRAILLAKQIRGQVLQFLPREASPSHSDDS